MMEIIKITKKVYREYRSFVRGNSEDGYMKTRKKLTRNWELGEFLNENEEYEWKNFGNLLMCRHKETNRIVNILNDRVHLCNFQVDEVYKKLLEEKLCIW